MRPEGRKIVESVVWKNARRLCFKVEVHDNIETESVSRLFLCMYIVLIRFDLHDFITIMLLLVA